MHQHHTTKICEARRKTRKHSLSCMQVSSPQSGCFHNQESKLSNTQSKDEVQRCYGCVCKQNSSNALAGIRIKVIFMLLGTTYDVNHKAYAIPWLR
jgi:hypothetical protein